MLNLPIDNMCQFKRRLLAHEAKSWLRFTESGGDNKGQVVEHFQKYVDGKATGEPWCMCLQQFLVGKVDNIISSILPMKEINGTWLYKSEHCLTVWNKSPIEARITKPIKGSIAIWQYGNTSMGHTGTVVALDHDDPKNYFWTVEGNTGPGKGIKREGDGVYLKKRPLAKLGNMNLKGFLVPWPEM